MNLYHYTDQNGFVGIMQNRSLWATKIQYLNDHNEYYLAIKFASESLDKRIEDEEDLEIKLMYQEFLTRLELLSNVNLCVCSLTEQGDLLSQWRGYSNKMGGYSIGFYFDGIKAVAEKNGFELVKCIYDESIQRKKVEQLINEAIKLVEIEEDFIVNRRCVHYFEEELLKLAPLLNRHSAAEFRNANVTT